LAHDRYDDHDREAVRLVRVTKRHNHTKHEIRTGRERIFLIPHPGAAIREAKVK
jgi:hypothetical protein